MREGAQSEVRPQLGRRRAFHATDPDNDASTTEESKQNNEPLNLSQHQNTPITQPFPAGDRLQPTNDRPMPADVYIQPKQKQTLAAQPGTSKQNWQLPERTLLQPETSTQTPPLSETSTPGQEPGWEPLPQEASGRLASPVTKEAPQQGPPASPSYAPAAGAQAGHLHDHDYFRRPSAVADHNYFRPLPDPEVQPPPGFENYQTGRPSRRVTLPNRYKDYDMS